MLPNYIIKKWYKCHFLIIVTKAKEMKSRLSPTSFIAIDLKSFYASVECVERGLNPLMTNLVVADESRTDKTICLAVSPSLKTYGIGGRARLFEVKQRVPHGVEFIIAPPRMALYKEISEKIYGIYLKYVAPEDIHIYSIDEVFMDVTAYLKSYKMTSHELAMTIIRDVLRQTGITATAGIGTNLYLCKVAMDILAKKMPADKDGVRIAELDEMSYRRELWDHRPLTDFWRVGRGTARQLAIYGIDTMGKIAATSIDNEELFYRLFGVNAELLIDHAWGWEPVTMPYIKAYRPETNSFSSGQVLHSPYTFKKARVVIREMADAMALKLVAKHLVTDQIVLTIGYDRENLTTPAVSAKYKGEIVKDHYGRLVPKHGNGTTNLGRHTSSSQIIMDTVTDLFDKIAGRDLTVRRLNLTVNHVINENEAEKQMQERLEAVQLDLFTDYEVVAEEKKHEAERLEKERRLQEARLNIKLRYGKNAILKGLNFDEGATAIDRNQQIGGHKAS